MSKTWGAVAALALAFVTIPAIAHHSGAMYERTAIVTLEGTIKAYEFTNPHVWFRILIEQDGKQVEWAVSAAAPYRMRDWGITPAEIKPGDKVVIRAHPLKDGRRGGILIDITTADGKVYTTPSER
jgi:hypothetical protein